MSGAKETVAPKEAVQAVVVPGTPQAEQDATLDESLRSLPVVDATERPFFGPLNRSAPAATGNVVAVETSATSTPSGTPSKSKSGARSMSSRSFGESSARAESDATIPFDSTGSIAEANSSVDESRRALPVIRSGEVGVRGNESLNGESSGDIPFDSTVDLAETTGSSASNSLLSQETSTEVAIRELRQAASETPKQKPFPYPRLELDEDSSPLKPINESSEPSGSGTPKTPLWHQQQAYRTLSPEKSLDATQASSNATLASTAPSTPTSTAKEVSIDTLPSGSNGDSILSSPPASPNTPAKAAAPVADSSVDTLPSASTGVLEASMVSSPPASPSTPEASANAAAPVRGDSSVATLPSASTGGLASMLSSPPASPSTPETSAQAAVRVLHEELRGVTPSKLLRVDREHMSLNGTPVSVIAERTEPSQDSGNLDELAWSRAQAFRSSSEESMDTSAPKPKPKATKRRLPRDADVNDTLPAREIAQARRSRRSAASSSSSSTPNTPVASKGVRECRRHCPTCRCDDADSPNNSPVPSDAESVAPVLDALPSNELSVDPPADRLSEVEVPRPRRRAAPRRQPKMSLEDAWKALEFIDDFEMFDLPAAPPKFNKQFNMMEGLPLTTDRIKKYGYRDDFQVALYEDGEVVFQGSFPGVNATTELLRRAIYQPVLAYHVPLDPVTDIEVGDDFFVMITKAGHFLSLGANDEGQLGATANPGRFRQRAVTPATMRRFPKLRDGQVGDIVFREIAIVGKTTWATDEDGHTYVCGEGFEPILTCEDEEEED